MIKPARQWKKQKLPLKMMVYSWYCYQAIRAMDMGSPALEKEYTRLTKILYHSLFDYIVLAVWGEARHCRTATREKPKQFAGLTAYAKRSKGQARGKDYNPQQSLEELARVFRSLTWSNGYGGNKWARICEAGLLRFLPRVTQAIWVDQVVSLSHHGGIAFDKGRVFLWSSFDSDYIPFLTKRRESTPENLLKYVSMRANMAFFEITGLNYWEYMDHTHQILPVTGKALARILDILYPQLEIRPIIIPVYSPIKWGNKVLHIQ